jgi:hypothetical protein
VTDYDVQFKDLDKGDKINLSVDKGGSSRRFDEDED